MHPSLNDYGGWMGPSAEPGDVDIAFVGEQMNPKMPRDYPPLYWSGSGTAGSYLQRSILMARLDPRRMYYTNAIKPRGYTDRLEEELHHLVQADHTIALGRIAAAKLWDLGVEHYTIPHPSFWARFHPGQQQTYANLIKELTSNG